MAGEGMRKEEEVGSGDRKCLPRHSHASSSGKQRREPDDHHLFFASCFLRHCDCVFVLEKNLEKDMHHLPFFFFLLCSV